MNCEHKNINMKHAARILLTLTLVPSLLCCVARAQTNAAGACGDIHKAVKVKPAPQTDIPAPQPGMATLVFIEDQVQNRPGNVACLKCSSVVRLGMDGEWIAAAHGFSHTFVSVPAGDHHLCAASGEPVFTTPALPAHASLHVEAGKTYFVQARLSYFAGTAISVLDLSPLDADEGAFLTSASQNRVFTLDKPAHAAAAVLSH